MSEWRTQSWVSGRKEKILANLAMCFAGISFAGYNVILSRITQFPPSFSTHDTFCRQSAFILYRQAGAATLLLLANYLQFRQFQRPASWREATFIALQGLTGIYMNQFFFLLGLKLTSASVATVMNTLAVPVTVMIASVARIERLTWRKTAGFIFGLGGAVVTSGPALWGGGHNTVLGVFLLLTGVIASSSYYLLQKPTYHRYPPLTSTAYQYFFGCCFMALSSCYCVDEPAAFQMPGTGGYLVWLGLEYAVLVASVINYFLMNWANKHIEASLVGLYGLIQPFSTALLAYIFLHQKVVLREVGGIALVMAGLAFVIWQHYIDAQAARKPTLLAEGASSNSINSGAPASVTLSASDLPTADEVAERRPLLRDRKSEDCIEA